MRGASSLDNSAPLRLAPRSLTAAVTPTTLAMATNAVTRNGASWTISARPASTINGVTTAATTIRANSPGSLGSAARRRMNQVCHRLGAVKKNAVIGATGHVGTYLVA